MSGRQGMRRFFLLGTTASGKTATSIELARIMQAEILSMDSMLVYQGMDIGTAKPTSEEREEIPHHLMDLVPASEEFSVSRWSEAAESVESQLPEGSAALYVGGTALYLKARVHGLFQGPEIPAELRSAVEQELQSNGREELLAELAVNDPVLASRLSPNDDKRLLRGIETHRATGRALSDWQTEWEGGSQEVTEPAVALVPSRALAHKRVEQRLDAMLKAGFLDEIRALLDSGGLGRSARQAIGYRQFLAHLESGAPLQEAREQALAATRRLVRRQTTWLRNLPGVAWLEVTGDSHPRALAQEIAVQFSKNSE